MRFCNNSVASLHFILYMQDEQERPSLPNSQLLPLLRLPISNKGPGYHPPGKILELKMLVGEFLSILDININ